MSESLGLSPIQLLDTSVINVEFFIDDDFEDSKLQGGEYSVRTKFATDLESEKAAFCTCLFEVRYSALSQDDSKKEIVGMECKYEARVGVLRSQIAKSVSDKALEEKLQTQAMSLGYSYLCSFVDNIARHSRLKRLYLPPIDVREYMSSVFEARAKKKGD